MSIDLPDALKSHKQLERASCAVSAFESIAKLHGFITSDSFPLQSDPTNQNKGFGETGFLEKFGLTTNDSFCDTEGAIALIERETVSGKFPLISLLVETAGGVLAYHVHLFARRFDQILLVDPSPPAVIATGIRDIALILEANRAGNPERDTLHLLTYTLDPKI